MEGLVEIVGNKSRKMLAEFRILYAINSIAYNG
jgi:hypothetical protein